MVDNLLQFAARSHMNMLRIWGQGMYESDYLYAKADELGLLLWQDFAFGNRSVVKRLHFSKGFYM